MHTNIDLDEDLVVRAMHVTGLRTKKAVVEEGLRALIRLHDQREVRNLRGILHWEDGRQEPPKKRGRRS
ncbi:MAG TPA: type II toxin-antitoxin system VapB family antitoxin [Thermoanaerobaculia bacterium]|nr:type II toxin-antitoxin system VapB family antitoxin [Thermoanaerobaculia bacterium]